MFSQPTLAATTAAIFSLANPTAKSNPNTLPALIEQRPAQAPAHLGVATGQTAATWASQPFQWRLLHTRLAAWSVLSDDWDGEAGIAPSIATIQAASSLARRLQDLGRRLPVYRVAGDGEIEFVWKKADAFASASFLNDGAFLAYSRPPGGQPIAEISEPYSDHLDLTVFFESLRGFA